MEVEVEEVVVVLLRLYAELAVVAVHNNTPLPLSLAVDWVPVVTVVVHRT